MYGDPIAKLLLQLWYEYQVYDYIMPENNAEAIGRLQNQMEA